MTEWGQTTARWGESAVSKWEISLNQPKSDNGEDLYNLMIGNNQPVSLIHIEPAYIQM